MNKHFKATSYNYLKISLILELERLQDEDPSFRLEQTSNQIRLLGSNYQTIVLINLHTDKIEWYKFYDPNKGALHDYLFEAIDKHIRATI